MSDTPKTQEQVELEAAEKFATANAANLPPEFGGDPAKFMESYKNLRASYTRATQELASLKKPAEEAPIEEAPAEDAKPKDEKPVNTLKIPETPKPEETPVSDESLDKEMFENGAFSDTTKAALKAKGLSESIVNRMEETAKAKLVNQANQAAELVGGMDELQQDIAWAMKNLPQDEKDAINQTLKTPIWKDVVKSIHARRLESTQSHEPTPTRGVVHANGPSGATPFDSIAQQNEAIRDKRYGVDKAYTELTQNRIRLTMKDQIRQIKGR